MVQAAPTHLSSERRRLRPPGPASPWAESVAGAVRGHWDGGEGSCKVTGRMPQGTRPIFSGAHIICQSGMSVSSPHRGPQSLAQSHMVSGGNCGIWPSPSLWSLAARALRHVVIGPASVGQSQSQIPRLVTAGLTAAPRARAALLPDKHFVTCLLASAPHTALLLRPLCRLENQGSAWRMNLPMAVVNWSQVWAGALA